tara:strand:+ start:2913 stop:3077 length:165 start_codon:yes stop_codon:yes gene_type:complete
MGYFIFILLIAAFFGQLAFISLGQLTGVGPTIFILGSVAWLFHKSSLLRGVKNE